MELRDIAINYMVIRDINEKNGDNIVEAIIGLKEN